MYDGTTPEHAVSRMPRVASDQSGARRSDGEWPCVRPLKREGVWSIRALACNRQRILGGMLVRKGWQSKIDVVTRQRTVVRSMIRVGGVIEVVRTQKRGDACQSGQAKRQSQKPNVTARLPHPA